MLEHAAQPAGARADTRRRHLRVRGGPRPSAPPTTPARPAFLKKPFDPDELESARRGAPCRAETDRRKRRVAVCSSAFAGGSSRRTTSLPLAQPRADRQRPALASRRRRLRARCSSRCPTCAARPNAQARSKDVTTATLELERVVNAARGQPARRSSSAATRASSPRGAGAAAALPAALTNGRAARRRAAGRGSGRPAARDADRTPTSTSTGCR